VVALLERLGHGHAVRLRVERRRRPVADLERRGDLVLGQPVDLGEHLASGVGIHIGVRALTQYVAPPQDLEQVELDVADVRLVVTQRGPCPRIADVYSPVT
jgi:hypothetical protein